MNALTVQSALDYEEEGFTFMALSPGWLKTELGSDDMADLTADEGAALSVDIILGPARGFIANCPLNPNLALGSRPQHTCRNSTTMW
ncbi:hypothetical protein BDW59DRAFT_167908 [Aspergillus cavernicola]|uniref:Uncharacterized protein n=1 Tax=Aspergillus cavernicola TaxID=176166 RepID=A0ABR4H987_9EURO